MEKFSIIFQCLELLNQPPRLLYVFKCCSSADWILYILFCSQWMNLMLLKTSFTNIKKTSLNMYPKCFNIHWHCQELKLGRPNFWTVFPTVVYLIFLEIVAQIPNFLPVLILINPSQLVALRATGKPPFSQSFLRKEARIIQSNSLASTLKFESF